MSPSNNRARHRAACRPSTPLTLAIESLAPNARRGVAAVASSGLVLTMAATSASATTEAAALPDVNVSSAVVEATTAMMTTPTVKVTSDAEWDAEITTAVATPPPPPPVEAPAPEPVAERQSDAASRAAGRAELPTADLAPAATAAAAEAPAPAPATSGNAIVDYARQFLGVPYVWGGTTPAGFDCSGFTSYVYAKFGISLPRTSAAQANIGTRVSAAEARPGDLVTWPGHVGIYTGNGNNIAARQPGTPLTEGPIYNSNPTFIRVS